MTRIPNQRYAAVIGEALTTVQPFLHRLGHVQFFCGTDPLFAGLHEFEDTDDGRSYRGTAHCLYPWHIRGPADRRVTTIVLPTLPSPSAVVHELGHALHETIDFDHEAEPVSWYAETNAREAFAEAFVAYHYWYGDQDVFMADGATRALFRDMRVKV